MPLEYNFDVDGDLLKVKTRGYDGGVDEAVSYGEAVISACMENQCWKILADESELTDVLDKVGQYEMVQRLVSQVPFNVYVAMVVSPANYENTSFATLVAENRGIHVKIFTSLELASEWLHQQEQV